MANDDTSLGAFGALLLASELVIQSNSLDEVLVALGDLLVTASNSGDIVLPDWEFDILHQELIQAAQDIYTNQRSPGYVEAERER